MNVTFSKSKKKNRKSYFPFSGTSVESLKTEIEIIKNGTTIHKAYVKGLLLNFLQVLYNQFAGSDPVFLPPNLPFTDIDSAGIDSTGTDTIVPQPPFVISSAYIVTNPVGIMLINDNTPFDIDVFNQTYLSSNVSKTGSIEGTTKINSKTGSFIISKDFSSLLPFPVLFTFNRIAIIYNNGISPVLFFLADVPITSFTTITDSLTINIKFEVTI